MVHCVLAGVLALMFELSRSYLRRTVDSRFTHGENCQTRNAVRFSPCREVTSQVPRTNWILNKGILPGSVSGSQPTYVSPQKPCKYVLHLTCLEINFVVPLRRGVRD